jgi:hypothetical protein
MLWSVFVAITLPFDVGQRQHSRLRLVEHCAQDLTRNTDKRLLSLNMENFLRLIFPRVSLSRKNDVFFKSCPVTYTDFLTGTNNYRQQFTTIWISWKSSGPVQACPGTAVPLDSLWIKNSVFLSGSTPNFLWHVILHLKFHWLSQKWLVVKSKLYGNTL